MTDKSEYYQASEPYEFKCDMIYGYKTIRPENHVKIIPIKQTPQWLRMLKTIGAIALGGLTIGAAGMIANWAGIPKEITLQLTMVLGFVFGFVYVITRLG